MAERFISVEEVTDRVGFSKTHIYRLIAADQFPRTVPVGRFRVAFLESEIDAWMAERVDARDSGDGRERRIERATQAVGSRRVGERR